MSSTNPSDPRLLLPEWLRDGDAPTTAQAVVERGSIAAIETIESVPIIANIDSVTMIEPVMATVAPFSERLSLDTRLDPGELVSAADLPKWLGGLERVVPAMQMQASQSAPVAAVPPGGLVAVAEPEPFEGVDAPETGVIDLQVNGWILVAGAIGLLVLLLAALRLYLS